MKQFADFPSKFPDKWLLFVVWLIVFAAAMVFGRDFLDALTRDLTMALLAVLGFKRSTTPEQPTTNIENVENVEQVSPEMPPEVRIDGKKVAERE